jgi:hypothetical protein
MTDTPIPDAPAAETPEPAAKPKAATPQAGKSKRPAFAVLERLFQLYPKMFGARFLPLKLGVYQELLALHPDEFKKEDLKVALGVHARSTRYLESVAAGHKRHDLNGNPVEDVAPWIREFDSDLPETESSISWVGKLRRGFTAVTKSITSPIFSHGAPEGTARVSTVTPSGTVNESPA